MSQPIDLETIERKAYSSRFRDGLHDIQIGLLLMGAWFLLVDFTGDTYIFREAMPIYLVYCAAISTIPWLGKRWITGRRMGTMKPGAERQLKIRKAGVILALFVAIQAFLVLLQTMGIVRIGIGDDHLLFAIGAGSIVFLPMAVIAHRNDLFRGYVHALLVGISVTLIILLDS
ncbi:hypothetical protein ACFL6R_07900, partial [Gemmatimonadota bacterium]